MLSLKPPPSHLLVAMPGPPVTEALQSSLRFHYIISSQVGEQSSQGHRVLSFKHKHNFMSGVGAAEPGGA